MSIISISPSNINTCVQRTHEENVAKQLEICSSLQLEFFYKNTFFSPVMGHETGGIFQYKKLSQGDAVTENKKIIVLESNSPCKVAFL